MTIEIMIRMTITHPLLEPMVNMMFQTWTAYLPRRPCQSPPPHTGKLVPPPHTDGRSFFKIVFIFLHFTQFCGIEIELFIATETINQNFAGWTMCRMCKTLPGFRKRVRTTFFYDFSNTTPFIPSPPFKSFQLPVCPQSLQFPQSLRFLLAFQTGAAVPRPNVVLASVLVMLQYVSQQMPIEHTAGYAASIGIDRGSHRRDAIPVESGIWNKNSVL